MLPSQRNGDQQVRSSYGPSKLGEGVQDPHEFWRSDGYGFDVDSLSYDRLGTEDGGAPPSLSFSATHTPHSPIIDTPDNYETSPLFDNDGNMTNDHFSLFSEEHAASPDNYAPTTAEKSQRGTLDVPTPIMLDESDAGALKRARNTAAARKSRAKRTKERDDLEKQIVDLQDQVAYWKQKALNEEKGFTVEQQNRLAAMSAEPTKHQNPSKAYGSGLAVEQETITQPETSTQKTSAALASSAASLSSMREDNIDSDGQRDPSLGRGEDYRGRMEQVQRELDRLYIDKQQNYDSDQERERRRRERNLRQREQIASTVLGQVSGKIKQTEVPRNDMASQDKLHEDFAKWLFPDQPELGTSQQPSISVSQDGIGEVQDNAPFHRIAESEGAQEIGDLDGVVLFQGGQTPVVLRPSGVEQEKALVGEIHAVEPVSGRSEFMVDQAVDDKHTEAIPSGSRMDRYGESQAVLDRAESKNDELWTQEYDKFMRDFQKENPELFQAANDLSLEASIPDPGSLGVSSRPSIAGQGTAVGGPPINPPQAERHEQDSENESTYAESIFSEGSIASSVSSYYGVEISEQLLQQVVTTLFCAEDLSAINAAALADCDIGADRFRRNIRRLVSGYGSSLKLESHDRIERSAAKLLQSRTVSARAAQAILHDTERTVGTKPESYNPQLRANVEASDASEGDTDDDEDAVEPRLDEVRDFLLQSQAYSTFKARLLHFTHSSYEKRIMDCLAEDAPMQADVLLSAAAVKAWSKEISWIPPETMLFTTKDIIPASNNIKSWIETKMGETWEWWPLVQRRHKLEAGYTRVSWRSPAGSHRELDLKTQAADALALTLQTAPAFLTPMARGRKEEIVNSRATPLHPAGAGSDQGRRVETITTKSPARAEISRVFNLPKRTIGRFLTSPRVLATYLIGSWCGMLTSLVIAVKVVRTLDLGALDRILLDYAGPPSSVWSFFGVESETWLLPDNARPSLLVYLFVSFLVAVPMELLVIVPMINNLIRFFHIYGSVDRCLALARDLRCSLVASSSTWIQQVSSYITQATQSAQGTNGSVMLSGSAVTSPAGASYTVSTLSSPSASHPSATTRTPITTSAPLPPTCDPRHLYLCIKTGSRYTFSALPVHTMQTDVDFFRALKSVYLRARPWYHRWFSMWRYDHCDFYQFHKYARNRGAPTQVDFPLASNTDYEFDPRPVEPLPPIGPITQDEFRDRFYLSCDHCHSWHQHQLQRLLFNQHDSDALKALPKRKLALEMGDGKREVFWGIYARERRSFFVVCVYASLCIVIPWLVFGFLWIFLWGHDGDLQNASVPIQVSLSAAMLYIALLYESREGNKGSK